MLSDRDKDYLTQKMNAMEKPRRSSSSYSGILSRYEGKRLKEPLSAMDINVLFLFQS